MYSCVHSRCSYTTRSQWKAVKHNDAEHFECQRCGPSSGLYTGYWFQEHLELHHSDGVAIVGRGPRNPALNPGKVRKTVVSTKIHQCKFAPGCPYTGPSYKASQHSDRLHMGCPVVGCNAVLGRRLFNIHINEKHLVRSVVQCPRDGCSSPQVLLERFWSHVLTHDDEDGKEDNRRSSDHEDGIETTEEPPCSSDELLAKVESDAREMVHGGWWRSVEWNEDWDEDWDEEWSEERIEEWVKEWIEGWDKQEQ